MAIDAINQAAQDMAKETAVLILIPAESPEKRFKSFGTGFVINHPNGDQVLATANHVIQGID